MANAKAITERVPGPVVSCLIEKSLEQSHLATLFINFCWGILGCSVVLSLKLMFCTQKWQ